MTAMACIENAIVRRLCRSSTDRREITGRQFAELANLAIAPRPVVVQLRGQECGHPRSGFDAGACIQEQGSRPPRQHVLDGARGLVASGPGHFARAIG